MALSMNNPLAFTFGILGNLISFTVFLAPVPTFIRIYRKKTTEGFQSLPYVVSLFSAMLWIYYALFKKGDDYLLITINAVGCFIYSVYLVMYLIYAPRKVKILTAKLIMAMNVGMYGVIVLLTYLLSKGSKRVQILGWICVGFSVSVFAAPLSIMRHVIRTKSVEFMPFPLSLFLTLSAIAWLLYGLSVKDKFVAMPNVLGLTFGVCQMVLYKCYKNSNPRPTKEDTANRDLVNDVVDLTTVAAGPEVHPVESSPSSSEGSTGKRQFQLEKTKPDDEQKMGSAPDEI